jgi:hypothetical protein
MALSERVKDICAKHFGNDCRGCPLQQACHRQVLPLTRETLAAWTNGLEVAAEKVR